MIFLNSLLTSLNETALIHKLLKYLSIVWRHQENGDQTV